MKTELENCQDALVGCNCGCSLRLRDLRWETLSLNSLRLWPRPRIKRFQWFKILNTVCICIFDISIISFRFIIHNLTKTATSASITVTRCGRSQSHFYLSVSETETEITNIFFLSKSSWEYFRKTFEWQMNMLTP
jgi:hypothetical protein